MSLSSIAPATDPIGAAILSAAARAFAVDGYQGVRLSEIAERAGTTKPTLYARFASKEALYEQTVELECQRLVHFLLARYAQALDLDPQQQIERYARSFAEYAEAMPDGFRLLFLTPDRRIPGAARHLDEAMDTIHEAVAAAIRRSLEPAGPGHETAAAVLASVAIATAVAVVGGMVENPDWHPDPTMQLFVRYHSAGFAGLDRDVIAAFGRTHPATAAGD